MKKTKTQKGITLIALIITIVVLLILAVVAISSIQNDGILSYANNAAIAYNQAQKNEQGILDGYLNYMPGNGSSTANNWTQTGTTITNGTDTLYVGDYVNYVSGVEGYTDTNGWQILGVENGTILLISSDNVKTLKLEGKDGYNNGITKLEQECSAFGKGTGASGARSIKVEDINKITGYNPETNDGSILGTAYGKTATFSLNSDGVIAITYEDGTVYVTNYGGMETPDNRVIVPDVMWGDGSNWTGYTRVETINIKSTGYAYNPTDLTEYTGSETCSFASDNEVYKMLFGTNYATSTATGNTGTTASSVYTGSTSYWLASQYELNTGDRAEFGLFCVENGFPGLVGGTLVYGDANTSSATKGVRPVVSLKSNVSLTSAGNGIWNISEK